MLVIAVLVAVFLDQHADIRNGVLLEALVSPTKSSFPPGKIAFRTNTAIQQEPENSPSQIPDRKPAEQVNGDPFAVKTWAASAITTQVATPAKEMTTAPVLPYSYAGKLEESDGRWVVYLVKGDTSFTVHQGETFDTNYRLNAIQAAQLEIEYLPLASKQTLPTAIEPQ